MKSFNCLTVWNSTRNGNLLLHVLLVDVNRCSSSRGTLCSTQKARLHHNRRNVEERKKTSVESIPPSLLRSVDRWQIISGHGNQISQFECHNLSIFGIRKKYVRRVLVIRRVVSLQREIGEKRENFVHFSKNRLGELLRKLINSLSISRRKTSKITH